MTPPLPKTYSELTGATVKIPPLPDAPLKISPPPYTYRHSSATLSEEFEIGVQTHEELVAFINWVQSDRVLPLTAVESTPRVY